MQLFFPPFAMFIITMTAMSYFKSVFNVGERSGFECLYGALPITNKQLVTARFLENFLMLTAAVFVSAGAWMLTDKLGVSRALWRMVGLDDDMEQVFDVLSRVGLTPTVLGAMCFGFGCFEMMLIFIDFIWGTAKEPAMSVVFCLGAAAVILTLVYGFDIDVFSRISDMFATKSGRTKLTAILLSAGTALTAIYGVITYNVIKNREYS